MTIRRILRVLASAVEQRLTPPAPPVARPSTPPPPTPAPTPAATNWELRTQAELVDHIEQHYHAGLRSDLPQLIDAARDLERACTGHASVPSGLSDLLAEMFAALDSHMRKEEHALFPRLRANARGGELAMALHMMEREHEDHADDLVKIRELTANLEPPSDATPAWTTLYKRLASLETDLREHIALENNVLFARARG
jgi:regulator of cell morphogenesis and NO signaling